MHPPATPKTPGTHRPAPRGRPIRRGTDDSMALPRIDAPQMKKQVSLPEFRRLTGHTAVGGACLSQGLLPGCEERTISQWSPFALGNPKVETVKDLISLRCKGAIGAPWFEDRERPIAGVDLAEPGGSYQSYSMLRDHRLKHARCPNSPGVMFDQMKGPPITSYDYGFYPADIRPPRYPISSTWISRSASELQKTLKTSKGR